jgi:hypothetical protein
MTAGVGTLGRMMSEIILDPGPVSAVSRLGAHMLSTHGTSRNHWKCTALHQIRCESEIGGRGCIFACTDVVNEKMDSTLLAESISYLASHF